MGPGGAGVGVPWWSGPASSASRNENRFAHFLRFRWGRVVSDHVIEDTQRFESVCARLAAAGVAEASAEPIQDAG